MLVERLRHLEWRQSLRRGRRNAARRGEMKVEALHQCVARWLETPSPDRLQPRPMAPTLTYTRVKPFERDVVATVPVGNRSQ